MNRVSSSIVPSLLLILLFKCLNIFVFHGSFLFESTRAVLSFVVCLQTIVFVSMRAHFVDFIFSRTLKPDHRHIVNLSIFSFRFCSSILCEIVQYQIINSILNKNPKLSRCIIRVRKVRRCSNRFTNYTDDCIYSATDRDHHRTKAAVRVRKLR